jgi:hypothetical protein
MSQEKIHISHEFNAWPCRVLRAPFDTDLFLTVGAALRRDRFDARATPVSRRKAAPTVSLRWFLGGAVIQPAWPAVSAG